MLTSHTHCQVAPAVPQDKTWQRVCLLQRTTDRQSRLKKNTECTTSYIKHLAVSALSNVSARIKSTCNLIRNRFKVRYCSYSSRYNNDKLEQNS